MRLTRLIIGALLVIIALFLIAGEQLAGASADAVINARLTTIRAPIAGQLSIERRALGTRVAEGEVLGAVGDPIADNVRLHDLLQERDLVTAEVARLKETVQAIESTVALLHDRSTAYRRDRIRQLEAELSSSRSQAAVAAARVDEAKAAYSRSRQLNERGLETSATYERNHAAQKVAALELEDAQQRAASSEVSLEAARRGTFLGDGYNDAPYSEQQISELSLRLTELKANLKAEESKAQSLGQRIASERLRVNRLSSAQLASNVHGSVWEVLAGNGETVQRGQDIMRLVDCRSTIVTLSVSERVYNRLAQGDRAMFKVSGDGRSFEGSVTRLAGSGAETIYRNLAIAPSQRHLQRYDVTLLVPALREDRGLSCAIGRTGRVFFQARPFDFIRSLWS
jgi:biotin carboxyl carrier protein